MTQVPGAMHLTEPSGLPDNMVWWQVENPNENFKTKSSRGPERLELACFSLSEQTEGLSCFSLAVPKPESPGYYNFESSQGPSHCCSCCSVSKSWPTLCDPMDCSIPGPSVLHYLLEFAQIHVLCQWCYLTILSSTALFSFCLQSFPASGYFPMSLLFA